MTGKEQSWQNCSPVQACQHLGRVHSWGGLRGHFQSSLPWVLLGSHGQSNAASSQCHSRAHTQKAEVSEGTFHLSPGRGGNPGSSGALS